jgi:hypothetical protein
LFDQVDKSIDMVLNSGSQPDVEQLTNKELMLIAAKALANQAAEG